MSAIGIALIRYSFLSFVKKRRAVAKTGRVALKVSVRLVLSAILIGWSVRKAVNCPDAGTVTVTGSVMAPFPSAKTTSTETSSAFGLANATNDRTLSVRSAKNRPLWRSGGARTPVWVCVMPSCLNCRICKPFSRSLGLLEFTDAQPETWDEPAPGVGNDVPRLRPNGTADIEAVPDVEILWKLRIGISN